MNRRSFFRCLAGSVPAIAAGAVAVAAAKPTLSATERMLIDCGQASSFPGGIMAWPYKEPSPMLLKFREQLDAEQYLLTHDDWRAGFKS